MAVQTYPYLVITDGTTTCTLLDGSNGATNFPLKRDGWAPAIAGLRTSPLAGQTPYEDVTEQMLIEINGSTAANALANLVTLRKLLEQAERWYRGENETAVLVKFAPQGSTVSATATPLQAAVLGGGLGAGDPGVKLAPQWDEVGRNYVIPNVRLTFTRRGLWLHTTTEASTPSAADNGELVTFTLTARDVKSPCKVEITNLVSGQGPTEYAAGGFLLLAEPVGGSAPIAIVNAEGGTATGYTSVAGGLNARNTNVLRYTPTGTTEVGSGGVTPSMPTTTRLMAIYANIRPSATVAFTIRMRVDSKVYYQYTPYVTIAADAQQVPRWWFLGVVAIQGALSNAAFYITAASASSSIDIDTVVYCDAEATQVVALVQPPAPSASANPIRINTGTATFDHRLLTSPAPSVKNGNSVSLPYTGDAVFVNKAAALYGVLLLTGGGTSSTGQEYRQANTSTDALLQNTWTVTRSTGYLVPQ